MSLKELDSFKREVDDLVDYVKSSAKRPGVREILVPGEPEYRRMEQREREGIYVDEATWEQIVKAAESVGVKL